MPRLAFAVCVSMLRRRGRRPGGAEAERRLQIYWAESSLGRADAKHRLIGPRGLRSYAGEKLNDIQT